MNTIATSELDFFNYKSQLKEFLKTQDKFKDYDFDGSNLSVLLDLLAYNTYQKAFYSNMLASEMFLDSVQLFDSALSHAKSLGYTPHSRISSSMKISLELSVPTLEQFVYLPRKTKFTSNSFNGKTYSFYLDTSVLVNRNTSGRYIIDCAEIFEGKYTEEKYVADGIKNQTYIISNGDVDIRSLKVYVTNPITNEETEFLYKKDIFGLTPTDRVFYVQCTNSKYEITFGQDVFGINPLRGQIIRAEYRISGGEETNGITKVSFSGSLDNNLTVSSIKTISPSYGGSEKESLSSIKFYAPKSIQIQDRAITENDYAILLKNNFPEIQSVSVIGGEKSNPPQYGKVLVYVDLFGSDGISTNYKKKLFDFLKQRTSLSIDPIILSPSFTYVELTSNVFYDSKHSNKTASDFLTKIKQTIETYTTDNLNDFGVSIKLSNISSRIDNADEFILSNTTSLRAIKEYSVENNSVFSTVIDFNGEMVPIADYALRSLQSNIPTHPVIPKLDSENSIRLPTIASNSFIYDNINVIIRDNGFGNLQLIKITPEKDIIVNRDIGTVNYLTGVAVIRNLRLQSIVGPLKLYGLMKNSDITATKNSILTIRNQDINIKLTEGS